MATIVIDPGHGGPSNPPRVGGSSWNNAVGPNGSLEKDLTLKVGIAARNAFRQMSTRVVMTRKTDINLGIVDRARKAKKNRADAFVSIHFNAPDKNGPPAQGTETWVESRPTKRSLQLAEHIQAAVVGVTGYRDRGVKRGNVSGVIRNAYHHRKTAHCLVEISFIDRQPSDEQRLSDPNYVDALGDAIVQGTMAYLTDRGLVEDVLYIESAEAVEDAASAAALGLLNADGFFQIQAPTSVSHPEPLDTLASPVNTDHLTSLNIESSIPVQRKAMAQAIVNFEARRDSLGRIQVYYLPPGDGGGRYEVAGINERYNKTVCDQLVALIRNGHHARAEELAVEFTASDTDTVVSWCSNSAIESYLRDTKFNRGAGGAAWILQTTVGVTVDRIVGPLTREAVSVAEQNPREFLTDLREAREVYERQIVGRDERSRFWRGLVNRWNKARDVAIDFLPENGDSISSLRTASPGLDELTFDQDISTLVSAEFDDDDELCCDLAEKGETAIELAEVPEKPDVIDKYTTKHHYGRSGHDISHIVIHYTTGNDFMGAVRTFEKPYWSRRRQKWVRTSAHYIVGRRGELVQMVDDDRAAWHAGNKEMNYKSIGIEHAAAKGNRLTQTQNNKTIELIRWLMLTYEIPIKNIIGHKCVRNTDCPGDILGEFGATRKSNCKEVNRAIKEWLISSGII